MSHRGLSSFTGSTKESPQPDPLKKGPASVFQLETFVVNLADTDQNAYLRVGIALGLDNPLSQEGKSEKSSSFTPQIRDAILSVLSTWHSGDLLAPGGRTKLKEALLKALQEKVPALGAVDVYFTDFLIQH